MPWIPELFSARALQRIEDERQRPLVSVPFFDGVLAGEFDALLESFAGEPVLHHPVRGRIRGARALNAYVIDTNAWLTERQCRIEDLGRVVMQSQGFEEVVLHLGGQLGRVELPVAIVAEKESDGRLVELRMYYSSWPLTGKHANRPPLLQYDPDLRESDIVAVYEAALAAGDVDAIVAVFEPDGYVREPAGGRFVHRGADQLRAFYELMFSNGGGIPLELCGLIDDGRTCALECNVVRWGKAELAPAAEVAVYARGPSGKLAAVRIYNDVNPPPLGQRG
jgi:SnoaL-like domain